jgi:catechol 2,3-dioxygenase-like lactoylglutathione lyase family enzyme
MQINGINTEENAMRRVLFCALIAAIWLVSGGSLPGLTQQPTSTEIAGGPGGTGFSDSQPEAGARILEVHIRSGDGVDSVQVLFALPDGRTVMSSRRGGSGGRLNAFRLDSGEYITGLSGRSGNYIDSVRIHTNKRTSQTFGGRGGDRDFRIDVPVGNQAVGIAGRAGDYLDAIGLIFAPIREDQAGQTTIAGGRGGTAFADRDITSGARITEVRVQAGDRIDAIQVVYVLPDGRLLEGSRHGGGGGRTGSFRLEPDEYITGLSGRSGNYIDSVRIHTNKRTSQTFGGRGGDRDFRIDIPAGNQAIGFIGRAADYVDGIGLAYAGSSAPSRRSLRQRIIRP